jgi:hypothetical protein
MFVNVLYDMEHRVWNTFLAALVGIIAYTAALAVYRLYFSPLAGFPGSKLAAVTGWYETYYQLLKDGGGQFTFKIAKWHEQYGRPLYCVLL